MINRRGDGMTAQELIDEIQGFMKRYDRLRAIHRFMRRPARRMFIKRRVSLHWMRT